MTRSGWNGSDEGSDDAPGDPDHNWRGDALDDELFDDDPHDNPDDDPHDNLQGHEGVGEFASERAAPISAYERPWRHPSELGPLIRHADTVTHPGRNLLVASAFIGLTFAVVLVRLVTAESAGRSASVQTATSIRSKTTVLPSLTLQRSTAPLATTHTFAATDDDNAQVEPIETAIPGGDVTTATPATTAPVPTSTTRLKNAASTPQPAAQRTRRSGVAVKDGSELLTSAKGLTNHSRIEVMLADGLKYAGEVTDAHVADGVALVTLDSPVTAPAVGRVDSNESRYMVAVEGSPVPCHLALRKDGMILTLDNDADEDRVLEGAPIMGGDGRVVGLTTWQSGTPHVVELAEIVDALPVPVPPPTVAETSPSNSSAVTTTPPASTVPPTPPSSQAFAPATTQVSASAPISATAAGGWFGVSGANNGDGVKVTTVVVGSPAQLAGVLPDSIIVSYGDSKLASIEQLSSLCHATPAGTAVDIGFRLAGSTVVIHASVVLAAQPG